MSPKSEEELAAMSPKEMVRYVTEWQPRPSQSFELERPTYSELAQEVAKVILAAPERYKPHIAQVVLCRPEFAYALLKDIRDDNPKAPKIWYFAIRLCEIILENPTARTDMAHVSNWGWVEVRRQIPSLIELGIKNKLNRPHENLLTRVRDVLSVLLDDPDPNEETDCLPEGCLGHTDPSTVVINVVRSRALLSLIKYAELGAGLTKEDQANRSKRIGPERLEPAVRAELTRKLNRLKDPSWAVHSVYGRCFYRLFCLDEEWTKDHIDDIFPAGDDEVMYYTAAWDSYVSYHRYWHPDLELLRPKYEKAIYNLGKGFVTRMHGGMSPQTGLAVHVADEYLRSNYDLRSPAGPHNLLALLYQEAAQEACSGVSWFFWRVFEANPQDRESKWPRVRIVWEVRSKESADANQSTDFDAEMKWFALLLPFVPESETLASLWTLLEILVPHITRNKSKSREWDAVEYYLSSQVDHDPVRAIRLYHQMQEQRPPYAFYRASDQAHKIIETAAADEGACREALSLINLLAQHNNYEFRDIYERHKDHCRG